MDAGSSPATPSPHDPPRPARTLRRPHRRVASAMAPPTPSTRPRGWCCGSWAAAGRAGRTGRSAVIAAQEPPSRRRAGRRAHRHPQARRLPHRRGLAAGRALLRRRARHRAAQLHRRTAGRRQHRSLAVGAHAAGAGPVHRQRQPGRAGGDGLPGREVDAADISPRRWRWRHQRRQRHSSRAASAGQSDGLAALPGPYDLVLCNPPYVNSASMAALPAEYRAEPALALAGGADGMDFVRRCCADAPSRA
jgi:hypothetical protein